METDTMPLNLELRIRRIVNRDTIYQNLMFIFCVLFGLALIANTQSAGDGGWFWYATLLHSGKRLYSNMHLALQPLFVLETAWFMELLGKGWLVSKVPAILHVVAYCVALLILVRRSEFSDGQKAVVLGCGFFVPICFEAYRFDDYHVLADCFLLYSLVALLLLQKVANTRTGLLLASIALCGNRYRHRVPGAVATPAFGPAVRPDGGAHSGLHRQPDRRLAARICDVFNLQRGGK